MTVLSEGINDKGFTLIELVIVIVLIGILSATALPKFANLTIQAHNAANQGIAGGLSAAVGIAHAAWIAGSGTSGGGAANVTLDNSSVHVNANGWPDGSTGAGVTTATPATCAIVWSSVLTSAPIAGCPTCTNTCTATSTNGCYIVTATSSTCTFTLSSNTPITITYDMSVGAVGFTSQ